MLEGLNAYEASNTLLVPRRLLEIRNVIREIFASNDPHTLIDENRALLNSLA
jgi:hypothetical protein